MVFNKALKHIPTNSKSYLLSSKNQIISFPSNTMSMIVILFLITILDISLKCNCEKQVILLKARKYREIFEEFIDIKIVNKKEVKSY